MTKEQSQLHSHAVVSQLVDTILTGTFFALIAFTCYAFYYSTPNHTDLLYFFAFCGCVVIAVKTTELLCKLFMRDIVSKHFLNSGSHPHPLGFTASFSKFVGTSWQFVIHTLMTLCEGYLLWDQSWLSSPHSAFIPVDFVPNDTLRIFYVLQTAIWIVTCFSHRFNSDAHAHKDYVLMYIHHLATIALVSSSFHYGQCRIGLVVLFIHDCSDIGIDLLKLTNYLLLEGLGGCFLTELSYTFAIVMWGSFRLWFFPRYVIWSLVWALDLFKLGLSPHGDIPPIHTITDDVVWKEQMSVGLVGVFLLTTLFIMHIWWFFLLARIALRMMKAEDKRQIASDEYEGDFDAQAHSKETALLEKQKKDKIDPIQDETGQVFVIDHTEEQKTLAQHNQRKTKALKVD